MARTSPVRVTAAPPGHRLQMPRVFSHGWPGCPATYPAQLPSTPPQSASEEQLRQTPETGGESAQTPSRQLPAIESQSRSLRQGRPAWALAMAATPVQELTGPQIPALQLPGRSAPQAASLAQGRP